MNTHKLTDWIIKDDRRVEQIQLIQTALMEERRTTPHNYFVGERERRVEQIDYLKYPRCWEGNKRTTPHNYDSQFLSLVREMEDKNLYLCIIDRELFLMDGEAWPRSEKYSLQDHGHMIALCLAVRDAVEMK